MVILCVDMDAFFASVEQQANPALRDKPIAVTGAGERTVITTSSYEARAYGVRTGMTPYQARKLCPEIIFVTGDNKKYARTCRRLEDICRRFSPDVEIYSIDEVFLDVTGSHHLFGGPEKLGRQIKKIVREELGINCTVGIGSNVLMAKLASDLSKPDGLRFIHDETMAALLETLPVRKLWGIGGRTEEKLVAMNIRTCGELSRASVTVLTKEFGVLGERLQAMGRGDLDRPLELAARDPKSIGHSTTFPKDLWKLDDMKPQLLLLSEMVCRRARRHGYRGRRITLTVRYSNFKTFTRQTNVPFCTNDTSEIYLAALSILEDVDLQKGVRLLGVTLSSFEEAKQMTLFENEGKKEREALFKAVDSINDKFGGETITWASMASHEEGEGVISPAWRPSGVRESDL